MVLFCVWNGYFCTINVPFFFGDVGGMTACAAILKCLGGDTQMAGVVAQMIFNKAGDEEIAVVITCVTAVNQWMSCRFTRCLQQLGFELLGFEVIGFAL